MKGLQQMNLKGSFHKKVQTQSSRIKPIKPRDHQAIKKFNKTIHQVKKSKKITNDHILGVTTLRSKTPSPLKENFNLQNNIISSYNPSNSKIKQQKNKDENFIETLFNTSKQIKKERKTQPSKNREHSKSKAKNKQNDFKEIKIRQLQQSIIRYQKLVHEKNWQIKVLTDKIHTLEEQAQKLSLNAFDVISVIKKFSIERQAQNKALTDDFINQKINNLTQNINFMVNRLKLQGKIKLKTNILEKQIQKMFQGRERAATEGRQDQVKGQQDASQKDNQKRKEQLQIFIDIISRRESIPSARKGHQEQKKIVMKNFYGVANAHELMLQKGDTISVLKTNPNGWWIGIKNGVVGYFPSDCLQ